MKSFMSKMMVLIAFTGLTASTVFAEASSTSASQPKQKVVKMKKHSSGKSNAKSGSAVSQPVTPTATAK